MSVSQLQATPPAAQEPESRYRTIAEIIFDYAYVVRIEPGGNIVLEWISDAFTRATAIALDKADTLDAWTSFLHPDDKPVFLQHIQTLLAGQSDVSEYRIVTQDGETRWLRDYGRLVWDSAAGAAGERGRVAHLYGAAQDITEHKRIEQESARNAQELSRSNAFIAALGRVAARIAATPDPDQVMATLGTELVQLGINSLIALLVPGEETLVVRHVSIESNLLAQAEKLVGLTARGFRIPRERWSLYTDLVEHRHAMFRQDVTSFALPLLPGVPAQVVKHSLRLVGVSPGFQTISLPLTVEERTLGMLVMWGPDLRESDLPAALVFAGQVAAALEMAHLFQQVQEAAVRLQMLSRQLVEAQELERRRLARELHDEIGQWLTGLKLTLELYDGLPASAIDLSQAQAMVTGLMARVQDMSLDLRPAMLDDLGLLPALLWLFERYMAQTRVNVTWEHSGLERRFAPEIETAAYRIVQEALTNVARHAKTGRVKIRLWADQDTLGVQIDDQGVGFEPEEALSKAVSNGLTGMHERAALLGGRLTIESTPGRGTHLVAELPLAGSAHPAQVGGK